MRTQIRSLATAAAVATACIFCASAWAAEGAAPVLAALQNLNAWLNSGPNAKGWVDYLNLPALEAEAVKGASADPAVIAKTIKQLDSGANGLELAPFRNLRHALVEWSIDVVVAKAGLPQAALESESNFQPITDADVAAAKTALEAAAVKLDAFLTASGTNGTAWKEYLRFKDLQSQLPSATPDAAVLKSVEQRFTADQNGLEMPVFADVGTALSRFIHSLTARRDDLRTEYAAQLKGLADELRQYANDLTQRTQHADEAERLKAATHSEEAALAVGTRLGWLQNMRQAPALVSAARNQYSFPNLRVAMSGRLVAAGVEQPVDDVAPVHDVILGTNIKGTGRTVGRLAVQLVPNNDKAELETMLVGTTRTRTVGRNGPATIYANGTTQIQGRKRMVVDANGLAALPATATATTKTTITGVAAGKGGIIQRIATKKVYQSKSQAEQIGSSHAAALVRQRVDSQATDQLGKAQADYLQKLRNPLLRRREFPALLKFNTSADFLFVTALQANPSQLGAPREAPDINTAHDLAVRIHESLVNNLAAALLSGLTLKEEELQAKVIELRGSLPEQLKSEEDRDPWSITFANSRPVTVAFNDNGLQVTVRGQRYTSGDRDFRAMNVTANYKVQISGTGSKLVRQGELEIVPPGFVRGQGHLSAQQVTLRTLLQRKFGKMFEPEIVSQGLTLPGRWEQAGRLDLKQLQADGGWLVMAWVKNGAPSQGANKVASDVK
ncbi:MAG: hypothetical protein HY288_04105 [Planctomycetia bacterium]|nr:hypothetical protein [Planctomycetia bacterium]